MTRFILASALILFAAPAMAQGAQSRGTQSDQQACQPDAVRLCRSVLKEGDFAVLNCLQENRRRLRRQCQAVLERNGV
jgi:hypothetical protein